MKIQVVRHVGSALAVCNPLPSEFGVLVCAHQIARRPRIPAFAEAWDQLIHDYKPRHSLVDGRIDRV